MSRMYSAAYHSNNGPGSPLKLVELGEPTESLDDAQALVNMANADDPSVAFFVVYKDDGGDVWSYLEAPGVATIEGLPEGVRRRYGLKESTMKPYPDIGQPCNGMQCAGEHPYCPDCDAAVEEFERDRWAAYYPTINISSRRDDLCTRP